jgi:hypothetical protein
MAPAVTKTLLKDRSSAAEISGARNLLPDCPTHVPREFGVGISPQLLAKIFKADVAENAQHHSDDWVRQRENILDGESQTLAEANRPREFDHQYAPVEVTVTEKL